VNFLHEAIRSDMVKALRRAYPAHRASCSMRTKGPMFCNCGKDEAEELIRKAERDTPAVQHLDLDREIERLRNLEAPCKVN